MNEVVNPENIPEKLKDRGQWLHWDSSNETPRRPHKKGDFSVAWSDPDEWMEFPEAVSKTMGNSWGVGYVTAVNNDDHPFGIVSVLDLDGAADSDGRKKDWVPSLTPFLERDCYAEYSPSKQESGDTGIHIPLVGQPPKWWSDTHVDDHEGIDLLANKFCTFTGDTLTGAGDGLADWSDDWVRDWLMDAHEALTGESAPPRDQQSALPDVGSDKEFDDDWPDADTAEDMLDEIDPDCEYEQWRNIGFALADHFPQHRAKRLFDQWSRGGQKYDDSATELIDDIASRGSGGVTIATLVHHAKQSGWEPEYEAENGAETNGTPTAKELLARHSEEFEDASDVPDDVFEATDSVGPEESETDESEGEEDGSDVSPWPQILSMYQAAEGADERLIPRHKTTERLLHDHAWRGVIENDSLWMFDEETGVFRRNGDRRVRQILSTKLEEQFRAHEVREICEQLKGRTTIAEDQMRGPDHMICAENCVIEIDQDTIETHDHSPEYNFVARLETEYDPEAECPRWREFVSDSVETEADAKKLQEFAGYLLWRWEIPFHKALFMVGPTASGKSTFLDTIRSMLGNDCTTSLTPQQMTAERFGGAELYGSWANIRNDIPNTLIENTGQFKEIVGGDPIKAEEKYQDPFFFRPTTKHMFSANELPDAETDDDAFYRRILLVPFPSTVPRSQRDPRLPEKLQQELPGILNWALEGLQRLMQQRKFTGDRSPTETQETWDKWGSSVERFEKLCVEESNESIPKGRLYRIYIEFCEEEAIPAETQHAFTRTLKSEGYTDGKEYHKSEGGQVRVFENIELTGRGKELADQLDRDSGESDSSSTGIGDY